MDKMLHEISSCRKCLATGWEAVHPPPVFSGDLDAPLLFIGQIPGTEELNQNKPFVGSSGKRLFSWLKQAGLEEDWARDHVPVFQRYQCYPGKQLDEKGDSRPAPALIVS